MECELADAAAKLLAVHGIGAGKPPVKPELWEQFRQCSATETVNLSINNRFYAGHSHSQVDWTRPVHAIFLDFKGDGMQLGKLVERLHSRGDQYVFVGNPLPFNGGWHCTAVNDFEHPVEQQLLDASWRNIRIWHRVNYVPSRTESGEAALTPSETFKPECKHEGALPISAGQRFASLYFIGGLMPHTLNATSMADDGPASFVLKRHFELGATFATIGHGLDVLLACGTPDRSIFAGFTSAVFPKQDHLLKISEITKSPEEVCSYKHSSDGQATLVSAAYWGSATAEAWFQAAGLEQPSGGAQSSSAGIHNACTAEPILRLESSKLPGMTGATYLSGEPGRPTVAVFVDDVADPIEIFTIMFHLIEQKFNFWLVSHSDAEQKLTMRDVVSETVFANAMYGLRDCMCVLATTPANMLPADLIIDGFFVAGGQCPYYMQQDVAIIALMNASPMAAAVCHGPEALIGSKWLDPEDISGGHFVSYYGAWISFRHVMSRYEKKKPGEICVDASGRLFTGNAPNSTKEMTVKACEAICKLKASSGTS